MNASEISTVTAVATALMMIAILAVPRILPGRSQPEHGPSKYLMDQLMQERAIAIALRSELDVVKLEITQLRSENAALKLQVADLFAMMRGQHVAASSTHDATRPSQPGNRTKHATAAFSDDDVAFRDWIIRHFDGEELAVLAANAGMDRPVVAPITSMATALVQASRRMGLAERLQNEALEMRPNIPAW